MDANNIKAAILDADLVRRERNRAAIIKIAVVVGLLLLIPLLYRFGVGFSRGTGLEDIDYRSRRAAAHP